jgi:membrane protease YdiL (CAAX protease family)
MSAVIRRHPLVAFFVLAFAITWAPIPFGIFMAAGPLLAAIVITAVVDGRVGLRELGSRMIRWRVDWQWYAAAILTPLAVVFGTGGLNVALGAPGSVIRDLSISSAVLLFALRLVIPVFSPIGEEPGWRGFALPRLLAERSPFEATLFLGLVVALWHVPLIFIASEDLPPIFLLTTVAVTFFYTWLFVHTGGSVFITIVAHATEGLIGRELTGDDGWTGSDETHWILLYTAGWCVVALALLIFDWKLWRMRLPSASPAIRSQPVPIAGPTPVSPARAETAT